MKTTTTEKPTIHNYSECRRSQFFFTSPIFQAYQNLFNFLQILAKFDYAVFFITLLFYYTFFIILITHWTQHTKGIKDTFKTHMCSVWKAAASEHRTRNLAITIPMRYYYTITSRVNLLQGLSQSSCLSGRLFDNLTSNLDQETAKWPFRSSSQATTCYKIWKKLIRFGQNQNFASPKHSISYGYVFCYSI